MRTLVVFVALVASFGLLGSAHATKAARFQATQAAKVIADWMPTRMTNFPGTLSATKGADGRIVVVSPTKLGTTTRTFEAMGNSRVKLIGTSVQVKRSK